MAEWASADDVLNAWILGDELPVEEAKVEYLIGRAQRKILNADRAFEARMAADENLAQTAKDVVVDMVIRVLKNPEGLRQFQETTGPFSGSGMFGGDEPGELYLSNEERAELGIRKARRQRAFSVNTTPLDSYYRGPTR